jgi:tetratricopeptide (TPR) repeat protein/tRNA A-37 threonylcarbamoyl transferase component Bud32
MDINCPKCHFANTSDSQYCKKCGAQLPGSEEKPIAQTETLQAPKAELTTGSTYAGRYQIIEELGKGGMGKVYKAHDTEIKEKVALKLIKPEIASDKKTIERFQNELKFARKISHRNVCRMYDLNKEEGNYFITMEYVSGEDLKSLIRRVKQLTVGTAISIAKQMCDGLSEAHRVGVVHRDLKPSNIMIDKDGNTRIMDFGIARSLKGKGITGAGVMIGTPDYMSPEQVESKEVDQRSDIYSLGVILYEMVTGRVPFEGDTPFSVGVKHKSEIPADPKEINAQIPEDLSQVILKCLEKDKERRYQSAEEVRSELENIEKGFPTTERIVPKKTSITSKEITVQFSVKKVFLPALIFVAVVIIGLVIWRLLPKKETAPMISDKPSIAVMYFENSTGDANLDHYRKAISDLLITDLGQSKYFKVLSGATLYNILRQLDQLEEKSFSSEVLKEVASRGGVDHIVMGSYTSAGDSYRINYTLLDANTAELLSSERVEGIGEDSIFSMVDELTRKIKTHFQLSEEQIANDIDKYIGEITTSSPEAYKYFTTGIEYASKAQHEKAIELYEKAVTLDPEFAMAYRAMAMAYGNLDYRARSDEYMKKAMDLKDRLSDRERLRIEADYYRRSEKTIDKSIAAFEELLSLYPKDSGARHNYAVLCSSIGDRQKAIEQYKICIADGSRFIYTYTNLAAQYASLGLYDKSQEILEEYLNNISNVARVRLSLSDNYRYQGKFDLALKEIDKAMLLDPTNIDIKRAKARIYMFTGEFEKAEEESRKLLEEKEPDNIYGFVRLSELNKFKGKFKDSLEIANKAIELAKRFEEKSWLNGWSRYQAYFNWQLGNRERALEQLDEVWENAVEEENLSMQRSILVSKGFIYTDMNLLDEAQDAANQLKVLSENAPNKSTMRRYYNLQANIELGKGNFADAISLIEKALSMLSTNSSAKLLYGYTLALAYYRSGDLEKARLEYEKIQSLPVGRTTYGDYYARSFYMAGKVCQDMGENTKAIENYQKFLDLWKDADPEFTEVDDAKARLAGLKSQ